MEEVRDSSAPSLEEDNQEVDIEAAPPPPVEVVAAVICSENGDAASEDAVECPDAVVYALPLEDFTCPTKSATVLQVLEDDDEEEGTAVTSPFESNDSLPTVDSSPHESAHRQSRFSWMILLFPLSLFVAIGLCAYATTVGLDSSEEDGDDEGDALSSSWDSLLLSSPSTEPPTTLFTTVASWSVTNESP